MQKKTNARREAAQRKSATFTWLREAESILGSTRAGLGSAFFTRLNAVQKWTERLMLKAHRRGARKQAVEALAQYKALAEIREMVLSRSGDDPHRHLPS